MKLRKMRKNLNVIHDRAASNYRLFSYVKVWPHVLAAAMDVCEDEDFRSFRIYRSQYFFVCSAFIEIGNAKSFATINVNNSILKNGILRFS